MTGTERFDDSISWWLEEEAPNRLPERVLEATFERTRRTRQATAWHAVLGRGRMARVLPAVGGASVVIAAVLALTSIPPLSSSGTPPPSATASPSASPGLTTSMWPQSTLEEVQKAQELADAGDPRYTWQLNSGDVAIQFAQNHPKDAPIFTRFLQEVLGWEAFRWDEAFAHRDASGRFRDLNPGDAIYVRCAPGRANPLYQADSGCAPTIDELRYETVKISVAQPGRQDGSGIWVVTGYEMAEPAAQADPRIIEAEATALLGTFLQARVAGQGAESFVDIAEDDPVVDDLVTRQVPLIYATSTGAPYERSEFEVVKGPVWPRGEMQLKTRLIAEHGATVVEQVFSLERNAAGSLRLVYEFHPLGPDRGVLTTTENGKAVPLEYAFLDGAVTYRAASPLGPSQDGAREPDRLAVDGLLPDDDAPRRVLELQADPWPIGTGCVEGSVPADAEALARSIGSDPDFERATAPVAVTIGGIPALQMDVIRPMGATGCPTAGASASATTPLLVGHGDRARLWLLDLPGGSARVLAIVVAADEDSFETLLEWAAPVVESIEFHAP